MIALDILCLSPIAALSLNLGMGSQNDRDELPRFPEREFAFSAHSLLYSEKYAGVLCSPERRRALHLHRKEKHCPWETYVLQQVVNGL